MLSKRFLGSLEWAEEKVRKKEAQTGSSHPSSVNDCTEELSHQRGRGGADQLLCTSQSIESWCDEAEWSPLSVIPIHSYFVIYVKWSALGVQYTLVSLCVSVCEYVCVCSGGLLAEINTIETAAVS